MVDAKFFAASAYVLSGPWRKRRIEASMTLMNLHKNGRIGPEIPRFALHSHVGALCFDAIRLIFVGE
jgi:hypothetical protein